MDQDSAVMKPDGLVEPSGPLLLPEGKVVEEGLKLNRHLVPIAADVEILPAEYSGPFPDVAEHLLVELFRPREGERRHAARWLGGEILHHRLPDVLRL